MDIGVNLPTHGVVTRDAEGNAMLQEIGDHEMRPVERAVRAEELGYHSVWLSDHVVTERITTNKHPANASGKRPYPEQPSLLDVPTTLAAIAARTSRLKFGPSVHIAPYRHPLVTAHEFATIDVLSHGRVILAVGIGWEKGEFAALGVEYEHRGSITEEAIQVYKLAWTGNWIDYSGKHFDIHDVSMRPKPVQMPHIPIWYGGMTLVAARRAARHCTAFFPMFLDAHTTPETHVGLQDEVKREAERVGRDLSDFIFAGFCQLQITDDATVAARFGGIRPLLTGTPEQVIDGISKFRKFGYGHLTLHFDCPSGTVSEWEDQFERFATDVLPFVD